MSTDESHIRDLMDAHDRRYEQRFADQEKSVGIALDAVKAQHGRTQLNVATAISLLAVAISIVALFRR
jgi:hypothetical protein